MPNPMKEGGMTEREERFLDALLNILDITTGWAAAASRLSLEEQMKLIDKYASQAIKPRPE